MQLDWEKYMEIADKFQHKAKYEDSDGRQLFLPVNDNYICRFTSFLFCSTAPVR